MPGMSSYAMKANRMHKVEFELRRLIRLTLPLALLATIASLSGSVAQTPSSDAAAANLPAGAGRDVFVQACSGCHSLGLVTGKKRAPDEWGAVIEEMIGQGAQIDATQAASIHDYLAANFSAAPGAGAAVTVQASASDNAAPVYPRPSGPSQWPAY